MNGIKCIFIVWDGTIKTQLNHRGQYFQAGQLSRHPRLRAWLLAAKYATINDQQLEVKDFLIEVLASAEDDFHFIMRYMMETYQDFGEETFREIIRHIRPEEEEKMMSQFAHEIVEKSKPEWLQLGELKGGSSLILMQLEKKFGVLSDINQKKILTADLQTIEKWSLLLIDAKTLDDVLGK